MRIAAIDTEVLPGQDGFRRDETVRPQAME